MKASLFITCLNDTLFPGTGVATTLLLERLGVTVDFPASQTCCGQMHFNTGYHTQALPLIRKFVEDFRHSDYVVTPSGSCAAMVRDAYPRAAQQAGDRQLALEVELLTPRVFELSEFITGVLGLEDVGAYYPHRVTYHPTCHAMRLLRVGDGPVRLLRKVGGLELLELADADTCCGFGGTFAVKNAETSSAMLSDKIARVITTRAEVCTAGDNSCLMHIGGGLSRLQAGTRVVHLAEILASTRAEVFA